MPRFSPKFMITYFLRKSWSILKITSKKFMLHISFYVRCNFLCFKPFFSHLSESLLRYGCRMHSINLSHRKMWWAILKEKSYPKSIWLTLSSTMFHRNWLPFLFPICKCSQDNISITNELTFFWSLNQKFICSGGNAPSYVYRLLTELYHPEDEEI